MIEGSPMRQKHLSEEKKIFVSFHLKRKALPPATEAESF